jgi:hypothetical protein
VERREAEGKGGNFREAERGGRGGGGGGTGGRVCLSTAAAHG